jgi:S-(hydroxymethyl)glutathione dehydrogenase/alcohol dehydrogenase
MLDGTTRFAELDAAHGRPPGSPIYHYTALGCFSDRIVVPAQCCVPLPAAVPLPVAALIGCAVTTGVGAVLNTAPVKPGSSVAIFGAGGVGLSAVLGARLAGAATIIVVDRAESKQAIAYACGATDFLLAGDDVVAEIKARTGGRGADYTIEAVGLPSVQETCLAAARPGGTILLAGLAPMGSSTNLPGATITRQEKTVKGSYYGSSNPARDFPFYADLYLQGRLELDHLVSRIYPLAQVNEAYADMLAGSIARGVILLDE